MPTEEMMINFQPSADSVRLLADDNERPWVSFAEGAAKGDQQALNEFVLRAPSEFLQQYKTNEEAAKAAAQFRTRMAISPESFGPAGGMAHAASPDRPQMTAHAASPDRKQLPQTYAAMHPGESPKKNR